MSTNPTSERLAEHFHVREIPSVQPEWCRELPLQQQSVLLLAARGPDGIAKYHPCKDVQRAYRGTVLMAAKFGRCLKWGEKADSFMSLDMIADDDTWSAVVGQFFAHADGLPHHFLMHLTHGAEIIGYKHPDPLFRKKWLAFYMRMVEDKHLLPETEAQMDRRLSDWDQAHWEHIAIPPPQPRQRSQPVEPAPIATDVQAESHRGAIEDSHLVPEPEPRFQWVYIDCPNCGATHDTEMTSVGEACIICRKPLPADAPLSGSRKPAPEPVSNMACDAEGQFSGELNTIWRCTKIRGHDGFHQSGARSWPNLGVPAPEPEASRLRQWIVQACTQAEAQGSIGGVGPEGTIYSDSYVKVMCPLEPISAERLAQLQVIYGAAFAAYNFTAEGTRAGLAAVLRELGYPVEEV